MPYELKEVTNGFLFVNEEVVVLSHEGEMMRVSTELMRTTTLLRAASDLLAVAARRMSDVRGKVDSDAADRGVPGAGQGRK